jgi:hypothetical protein
MKGILLTLSLFALFAAHAAPLSSNFESILIDAKAGGDQTILEDRFVLEGQISWGSFVNCELFNETQNDLMILRYVYEFWIRNQFGQIERRNQLYQCVSGCMLESFGMVRLIGPINQPFILRASCRALVERIDMDDDNDDDFNLRKPKVYDRW